MKKIATLLAGLSLIALPAAAQAQVQINYVSANPVPGSNNFQTELANLGYTQFTTIGATLTLLSNSNILFEFLGSESGFDDTFTAGPANEVSGSESSSFENHFAAPIVLGGADFLAGNLANLLNFTSSAGAPATVGQDGFGIFLLTNQTSGDLANVFYLGYDDQVTNQDDNHDDFIVRATVQAVPEPGTWAMMLIGFAGVGYSMRRRRTAFIPQAA